MKYINDSQWETEYEQMPRVRGYTEAERNIIDSEPQNSQQRIAKIQKVMEIDQNRYQEFKEIYPDQSAHMDRLIEACVFFAQAMVRIYSQDCDITISKNSESCPEDIPTKGIPTLLNVEFIDRPA